MTLVGTQTYCTRVLAHASDKCASAQNSFSVHNIWIRRVGSIVVQVTSRHPQELRRLLQRLACRKESRVRQMQIWERCGRKHEVTFEDYHKQFKSVWFMAAM